MPVLALPVIRSVVLGQRGPSGFITSGYRAQTTAGPTTSGGTTLNKPTGTVDGDLLIAALSMGNTTVSSVPSGWNLVDEKQNAGNNWIRVYWKVASGEGASWSWSFGGSVGIQSACFCYASAPTAAVDTFTNAAVSGTSYNVPSITTTVPNTLQFVAFCSNGSRSYTSVGAMNEQFDPGNGNPSLSCFDEVVAASGASGTRTATPSASTIASVVIAAFRK